MGFLNSILETPPGAPEGLGPGAIEGADRAVAVGVEDQAGGPIGLLRALGVLGGV